MNKYDINSALESLIGSDALSDYHKQLRDEWKDSRSYWNDVDARSKKDLEKLNVAFSIKGDSIGIFIYSAIPGSEPDRWISLSDIVDNMDSEESSLLIDFAKRLLDHPRLAISLIA